MRTARNYLALEIYRSSAVVLLALLGLFTFFSLIEELDNVGSKFTLLNLFYLEALSLPTRLYDLLPIGLLIGAILALAGLAQRNELVILRVSGVSGLRLLATLWLITLPLVAGAFIVSEVITPAAEIKGSEASMRLLGKAGGGRLKSGYWFKEGDSQGGTRIINIERLMAGGDVAGITLYELDRQNTLQSFSRARHGRFEGSPGAARLILDDIEKIDIATDALSALADAQAPAQPMTQVTSMDSRSLDTTLTPERLIARVLTPERMAITTLLDYIDYLDSNQLLTDRQVVALWRKFAYPFTLLVMITIAAPISFMQTRRGGVGGKVFIGILLGVGFYMANQLALNVGMLGKWAPWVTALVPGMLAWMLSLAGLLIMENRHSIKLFRHGPAPRAATP